jgi:hypothetical protein
MTAKDTAELAGGVFFLNAVLGLGGKVILGIDAQWLQTVRIAGFALMLVLLLAAGVLYLREQSHAE